MSEIETGATSSAAKRKRIKCEESSETAKKLKGKPEKWQLTVAQRLLVAQEKRLKHENEVKPSYGWFTFTRDLLKNNNNCVSLKLFRKKALQYYDSQEITEIERKDFTSDMLTHIMKHPKFEVNFDEKTIRWVESRNPGKKRDDLIRDL